MTQCGEWYRSIIGFQELLSINLKRKGKREKRETRESRVQKARFEVRGAHISPKRFELQYSIKWIFWLRIANDGGICLIFDIALCLILPGIGTDIP